MNTRTQLYKRQLLTEEERAKIKLQVNPFDSSGMLGQFPHLSDTYVFWKRSLTELLNQAEETVLTILDTVEFKNFRRYSDGPCGCQRAAEDLDDLISGKVGFTQVTRLWSIQQYNINHNLMLVLIKNKLKLCTSEYVYQNQHMSTGVHWYRILNDMQIEQLDSFRLHQALTVLSNPKTAWEFLRAHVHLLETYTD